MKHTSQPCLFILLLLIAALTLGVLHQITPSDNLFLHQLYRRAGYFPIVVAALLHGMRGGLLMAFAIVLAFIPHLRHFYHVDPLLYRSDLTEIVLYFAAGGVVGGIAGRERKLREKYRDLSRRLEKSYNRLHEESALLIKVEEQLRSGRKFAELGRLAASLAHEIKNPLAGIRGAAEILVDDFPPGHPKREFVEILLKESARLGSVVDEVLSVARDQRPLPAEPTQYTPLGKVLADVITLLDGQRQNKNITISKDVPQQLAAVPVDGDKMSRVFINLLVNALEALEPGGRIHVSARQRGNDLLINFADNGPGVAPSEKEKIFQPFYSRRTDGTGLGLAISGRIMESLGGELTLEDSREGGALFVVCLPGGNVE